MASGVLEDAGVAGHLRVPAVRGDIQRRAVRFAAARWVYLGYAVPALTLAAARWKRWSLAERLYLRWGWVPALAFGVPVALPWLRAAGLIRYPLG